MRLMHLQVLVALAPMELEKEDYLLKEEHGTQAPTCILLDICV
jgi:hypothetical protein